MARLTRIKTAMPKDFVAKTLARRVLAERSKKALEIGARIAQARARKGLTQAQVAAGIGTTVGAVAQYETGRNMPAVVRLERIARALEVSTEWLLTGDEPDQLVRAQTIHEEHALRLIRALPAEQQVAALAMLSGLVQAQITKKSD
jgi:transcriptional regulator with XRE-family HTH domain